MTRIAKGPDKLRASVLDCASPLALLEAHLPAEKRQRAAAVQNLADAGDARVHSWWLTEPAWLDVRYIAMNLRENIQRTEDYLTERFLVEKLNYASMVRKKEVPVHRLSWAYYMGGSALFFFLVQLVTGLLLLFYYQPTVSDAHASVEFITKQVPGGALVRNMHAWASSLMIAAVMVHLVTAFAMKAFDRPRELTWVSGVLLLGITFAFGFTGYLLPWHQIAVNATKIGLESIEQIGQYLPGRMAHWPTALKETIQGGPTVGQATLSRFFALHVIVLPLAIAFVLGLHLLSVQLHGMSRGVDAAPAREVLSHLLHQGPVLVGRRVYGAVRPRPVFAL